MLAAETFQSPEWRYRHGACYGSITWCCDICTGDMSFLRRRAR